MMPIETLIFFIVGEILAFSGIFYNLKEIIRIARSETIWGEIITFYKLPEDLMAKQKDELPDYFIEVKYEHKGTIYQTNSIIKKDIHYERGGKIKVFIKEGNSPSVIVNYNTLTSYYVGLVTSIFIGLFFIWRSFFV